MTVSERTSWFNLGVGLYNIISGLIIECLLVGGCMIILKRFPSLTNGISVNVLLPFVLFAGLILAMMISAKLVTWVIVHFELEDKLDKKLVDRYVKKEL